MSARAARFHHPCSFKQRLWEIFFASETPNIAQPSHDLPTRHTQTPQLNLKCIVFGAPPPLSVLASGGGGLGMKPEADFKLMISDNVGFTTTTTTTTTLIRILAVGQISRWRTNPHRIRSD